MNLPDHTLPDTPAIIYRYFPDLTETQHEAFDALGRLYHDANSRVNLISRQDTGRLYLRHILHSLAIGRFLGPVAPQTTFMDLGTGGGFPGIPLAILYPRCSFHCIDRIGKKIREAAQIASAIGLKNITFQHGDSAECRQTFHYVVSRAVMPLPELIRACRRNVSPAPPAAGMLPPGLICLKGGDLADELARAGRPAVVMPVSDWFADDFFGTKKVVYVDLSGKPTKNCVFKK